MQKKADFVSSANSTFLCYLNFDLRSVRLRWTHNLDLIHNSIYGATWQFRNHVFTERVEISTSISLNGSIEIGHLVVIQIRY
jgi:hypothetical protein